MAIDRTTPSDSIDASVIGLTDFMWDEKLEEPHVRRAAAILKAHPEVKELFGYDPNTKYIVFLMVAAQFVLAGWASTQSIWVILALVMLIGAPINHACAMAIHEITHGTAFEKTSHNYLLAIMVNFPMGVPSAMYVSQNHELYIFRTFKKYHMEHHMYLGTDGYDTDLATKFEGKIISSNSRFLKAMFVFCLAGFYGLRPLFIRGRTPGKWEILNFVCSVSYNYFVYSCFGMWAIYYMLICTWFGMGAHPVAGHLLHEHYISNPGQETYSYYGWANAISFNVGYHNEHHDFPLVPYSKLPKLREIAPEFYNGLQNYSSFFMAHYNFVMQDGYGPLNRIKRTKEVHTKGRREFCSRDTDEPVKVPFVSN